MVIKKRSNQMSKPVVKIAFCLALLCELHDAFAIDLPTARSAVNQTNPARVGQQLEQSRPQAPNVSPTPEVSQAPSKVVAQSAKIHLKLNVVVLEGNTVFSDAEIRPLYAASLHKTISLLELQNIVHNITVKYREAGYILSRALLPPQTIHDGVVKIQIVEGYVSNVTVKGDPGKARSVLEGYGKYISASRPLNINVLQRYALLANDLPGLIVKAILNPSKTTPAGADLTLLVERSRANVFATYDNYGTRYIGPHQGTLGASAYSLFAPGDINTVRISTVSRTHQLRFAEITHGQPLGSSAWKLLLGTNYAETRPGFVLTPAEIVGHNTLVFADLSYPIIRERSKNFIFHTGANYQNTASTLLGEPFYSDRIRSLVLGVSFDKTDSYNGVNSMGIDAIRGFDILGASQHENQSRLDGHSAYLRLDPNFSRLQALTNYFSLYFAARGQYAFQSLLASEQFGVGGPDIGRGYDPSEIVGDRGVAGKLEFRVDVAPGYRFLQNMQYYGFYDAGIIWNMSGFPPLSQSVTSTGVGARMNFLPHVSGNLFIAKPLTHSVATQVAMNANPRVARVFFQINVNI